MLLMLYKIGLLVLVFLSAFFIAAYLNLVLETPPLDYLISSALIAVAGFLLTIIIGYITLPPLRWVNGEPQDLRTALWDLMEIISAVDSVLCFSVWQFLVRKRRLLNA